MIIHKTNSHFFIIILLLIISNEIVCDEICNEDNCVCADSICTACKPNHYFLRDKNDNNCHTKGEGNLQGFYLYRYTDTIMEKCHNNCSTCKNGQYIPSDTRQNCIKCENGLYKIDTDEENKDNCYNAYDININYYKDTSVDPPIFKPCYYRCKTCSELGNDEDHKCDSCKGGSSSSQYYKLDSPETGNCYLINEIPENYDIPLIEEKNEIATIKINQRNDVEETDGMHYVHIYEKIAIKCHKNCKTCTKFGDDVEMNCKTCKDGYFFYKNNCYKSCPKPDTYQLKGSNYECKELIDGKIITDYDTTNDIVDFLLYHGLSQFDFEESLILGKNMYAQIYSFKNKKTNEELSDQLLLSKISINDECLNKIIDYYQLKEEVIQDLIIIKIDKNYTDLNSEFNSSVNQINFYLFYPSYSYDIISGHNNLNDNYTEIELSICKDIKDSIQIIKPLINKNETLTGVKLSEAFSVHKKNNLYDIFISSNIFFSDICSIFKSSSKKDVELAERRDKYYQNISVCEGNCIFSGFDYDNLKIICTCDPNLFLTNEQTKDKNYLDVKNSINNLTTSTFSNKFPDNISYAYTTLNLKTMKCKNLIFDSNIAVKNIGNWLALALFIGKLFFLIVFLKNNFIPLNEECDKRKEKIEKEILSKNPKATIISYQDLAKMPKYHIEKTMWTNYAGSFNNEKSKKDKKKSEKKKNIDEENNKYGYNRLLINQNQHNNVGITEYDIDEDDEESENNEKNTNGNPPKRLGYVYSDDRADEIEKDEKEQNNLKKSKILKEAMKDLNYTEKEKNINIYFDKDNGDKKDFTNAIFPLSKENLNNTNNETEKNNENEIENITNKTSKTNKKKKTKRKKTQNYQEKANQTVDFNKINFGMNKNDIKEEKDSKEEKSQKRKKYKEKNYMESPEDNQDIETGKNTKKSRKKKQGTQNILEDFDEFGNKKIFLDDKNIGKKIFKVEPSINYRFSSMTSPEKLIFMKYKYAIELDKRTFMEIYWSCVKMSQIIINFILIPYYNNMKFLKLFFLMFVINLNIFTTTIFYSHYFLSKMYGFKVLMCILQSLFVSSILYLFSFTKKKFISVHVLDIWKMSFYKTVYLIIVIIAIVVEIIFSGFIWFLSSAFCSVYQNSYGFYFLHIIESCAITFALPFLFSFIPTSLRYIALMCDKEIIFCINDYVDIFF